jgi:hypothetical protein
MNNTSYAIFMADYEKSQNKAPVLLPIEEVLAKGTIFKDLYQPYKIIPTRPTPPTDDAAAMQIIQNYAIAAIDLNLYLDVHPNDKTGIELFNEIMTRLKKATKDYEEEYGAISLGSDSMKQFPWQWLSNWPWMGDK